MKTFKKIKDFIGLFVNGIWSGIPVCCTLYFCKKSFNGIVGIVGALKKKRGAEESSVSYVRCDKCYEENRIVRIKKNGVLYLRGRGFGLFHRNR